MIKVFRDHTLTDEEVVALEHVVATAKRKHYFALFVANLYDSNFLCDMNQCMNYLRGERDDRLKNGLYLMLKFSSQGIECHEYLGSEVVQELIDDWDIRRKPVAAWL